MVATATLLLLGAQSALGQEQPSKPFRSARQGEAALATLGDRLPQVASLHGMSPQRLANLLTSDNSLFLGSGDHLLYLDTAVEAMATDTNFNSRSAAPTSNLTEAETFQLHSLPGSQRVLYLDFDGHVTSGTLWNTYYTDGVPIDSPAYDIDGQPGSFGSEELARIAGVWERVAEDFAIYDVDVTTELPPALALERSTIEDPAFGTRMIVTSDSSWIGGYGGVAFLSSFDWGGDTPAFTT